MEKETRTTYQKELIEHSFYCDECERHLGTSKEFDDGWYQTFGEFQLRFKVDGWYYINKHLCEHCRNNIISKIKSALKDIGFKEGYE
jgi:hypothetical protein